MRTFGSAVLCGVALLAVNTHRASAQTTYQAFLTGLGENPPNASPGTGFGTLVLDASQTQITVDESWSGLTAPATASHIHNAAAGTNGPVIFPFSGVPAATAGAIPEQSFAITAAQVVELQAGRMYMNVHTSTFPGGEIRAQLLPTSVPEPSTLALSALGAAVLAYRRARRHSRLPAA
jgi:hypothetical protein